MLDHTLALKKIPKLSQYLCLMTNLTLWISLYLVVSINCNTLHIKCHKNGLHCNRKENKEIEKVKFNFRFVMAVSCKPMDIFTTFQYHV